MRATSERGIGNGSARNLRQRAATFKPDQRDTFAPDASNVRRQMAIGQVVVGRAKHTLPLSLQRRYDVQEMNMQVDEGFKLHERQSDEHSTSTCFQLPASHREPTSGRASCA